MSQIAILAEVVLLLAALLGHGALCVAFSNHLNATALRHRTVAATTKIVFLFLVGWPLWLGYWANYENGFRLVADRNWSEVPLWMRFYFFTSLLVSAGPLAWHVSRSILHRCPELLRSHKSEIVDVAKRLGHRPVTGFLGRALAHFPYNQLWQIEVNEKEIELPQLPKSLDGMSIAHLSDLHFTGSVTKDYYEEVVCFANDMQADLVAITGDIFDDLRLAAWLPDTLGKLKSRNGAYFILGNHDHAYGAAPSRSALTSVGLVDLAAKPHLFRLNGCSVLLDGSEHPWGRPPMTGVAHHMDTLSHSDVLRVLLAHTPDNLPLARRAHFDLMLAGHSHGGQIRLPWIGPVVCPLRGGIKYAADTFYEPPTVMHVSRGISSQLPIRLNCRPELIKLVLRSSGSSHR